MEKISKWSVKTLVDLNAIFPLAGAACLYLVVFNRLLEFDPHFAHQHFHVIPDVDFGAGRSEQVRRVVSDNDATVAISVENSAQAADGLRGLEKGLGGNRAQADDELWLNDLQLLVSEVPTVVNFYIARIAVPRGPAFDRVEDVNVFSFQFARSDDLVEQLARSANEGFALLIFVSAGGFSQQANPSVRIADAKHGLLSGPSQVGTFNTANDFRANYLQRRRTFRGRDCGRVGLVETGFDFGENSGRARRFRAGFGVVNRIPWIAQLRIGFGIP